MHHGGSDGDEFGHVLTPVVAADVEPDSNDPVGAESVGFLFILVIASSRA